MIQFSEVRFTYRPQATAGVFLEKGQMCDLRVRATTDQTNFHFLGHDGPWDQAPK
jgi:hypothetical protein